MNNKLLLIVCIALIQCSFISNIPALSLDYEELAYDDGSSEWQWSKTEQAIGDMYAVEFTPYITPCQLISAQYYLHEPATFIAHIFDQHRNSIFEKRVTPNDIGWFNLDLSQENIIIESDFYIAMEYIQADKPVIGFDTNYPDYRSWNIDDGIWEVFSEIAKQHDIPEGDIMIRAVTQLFAVPIGEITEVSIPFDTPPNTVISVFVTIKINLFAPTHISLGLQQDNPSLSEWVDLVKEEFDSGDYEKTYTLATTTLTEQGEVDYSARLFYLDTSRDEWILLDVNEFSIYVALDTDGDGLNDDQEEMLGTNPDKSDSDEDGLNDNEEYSLGTNPLEYDSDNDGLYDGDEIQLYLTNPISSDSDNDGLSDGEEIAYQTNPLEVDTDGDGLSDKTEIENGTNPLKLDSDNDGLSDDEEIQNGTNPFKADTDSDLWNDATDINPKNLLIPNGIVAGIILVLLVAVITSRRRLAPSKRIAKKAEGDMKRCSKCGDDVRPEFSICPRCGEIFEEDTEKTQT